MEDDILLDMYRSSWDAFLEAYKDRLDENQNLKVLASDMLAHVNKNYVTKYEKRLTDILEA